MTKRNFVTVTQLVLATLVLLLAASAGSAQTSPTSETATSRAPMKMRSTTNVQRKAAAARAAVRRAATAAQKQAQAQANGQVQANAPVGPPGGGALLLDQLYFSGTFPNYANSPLPDLSGNNPACVAPNFCGIRKFVDALPGLGPTAANGLGQFITIAHPDTTTFPGSDYYEISLREFSQKLHSDLPPTQLRGYVQTNNGTDASGNNTIAPDPIHYLGPLIIAQTNRPVRIKFTNELPFGAPDPVTGKRPGDLFIPVDKTVMGAGMNAADGQPYLENRATLHLHGGNTPWISDGTPHQWTIPAGDWLNTTHQRGDSTQFVPDMFFVNGAVVPQCTAVITTNCSPVALPVPNPSPLPPGATNDPGNGSMTFFYTNQQSARLMFYHDHSYGITRLNVYAGEAAGYLLVDQVEQDLINGTNTSGVNPGLVQAIPADQIPLVIQDKTFVPNNPASAPVYSVGLLQVGSGYTAPTVSFSGGGCTTLPSATATAGIVMDPFGQFIYGAITDITLLSGGAGCTSIPVVTIADTPPGVGTGAVAFASLATLGQQDPTWDTTLWGGPGNLWFPHVYMTNQWPDNPDGSNVNPMGRWDYGSWFWPPFNQGTFLQRGEINCQDPANPLWKCPGFPSVLTPAPATDMQGAGSIASLTPEAFMDTPVVNGTAYPTLTVQPKAYRFRILSAGNDRTLNLSWFVACGSAGYTPGVGVTCPSLTGTEVPMVPAMPNPAYPAWWPTDGRAGGVPDPAAMGPNWNVIGSEGGLLPQLAVIPPAPVGYEYNRRSVTVLNVSSHSLMLMPAERSDVIVDFSNYAGKTLLLYNDAPAPVPAFDTRYDYYTGDPDQTAMGGAPTTLPGFGPNTRTVMQVQVAAGTPAPFNLIPIQTLLPAAFKASQPVPVVPEPAFNQAYGGNFPAVYGKLQNNNMTFTPIGGTAPVSLPYQMKTIQELFELNYGRMNATLGTELPFTNFNTQTTIPLGYVDPSTEILTDSAGVIGQPVGTLGDGSQVWMITHNGVDSHAIHFHLFNVQVLNRFGWDGTTRPPDPTEMGWKDTVRMNPLEIDYVALRPVSQTLPWPLPDSIRLLDVTMPENQFDPALSAVGPTGLPVPQINVKANFGWEYVWHCHILGHEENDMMRAITFQVPPAVPANLFATLDPSLNVNLTWTDMSMSASQPGGGFNVQSALDAGFTQIVNTFPGVGTTTGFGSTVTFTDTAPAGMYWYRVQAFSANGTSAWTGGVQPGTLTTATAITVASPITYGTAAPVTVTVTATGGVVTGNVSLTVDNGTPITQALAGNPGSTTFTLTGLSVGSHTLVANFPGVPPFITASTATSSITVNPVPLLITASSATIAYGSPVPTITPIVSGLVNGDTVASLGAGLTCSTTYTLTAPNNAVGAYPTSCTGAVNNNYTITYATGTVTVTPASLTITASSATIPYGSAVPVITASYAGFVAGDTAASLTTQPTCSTTYTTTSPNNVVGTYPSTCSGAVDANYTIGYVAGAVNVTPLAASVTPNAASKTYGTADPVFSGTLTGFLPADGVTAAYTRNAGETAGTYTISATLSPTGVLGNYTITYNTALFTINQATTTTTITSPTPNPSVVNQPVTVGFSVAPQFTGTPTGNVTVTASTGESCTASVSVGSCSLTFLFAGTRTMTATYGGDTNFFGSASTPSASQNVIDFVMGVNPGSKTVQGGQKASYTLTVTAIGGVAMPVNLSCSVPQPAYTCTISPTTVTPNGGAKNATVTVNTVRGFAGTYTLTFTGNYSSSAGALTRSVTAKLTVTK